MTNTLVCSGERIFIGLTVLLRIGYGRRKSSEENVAFGYQLLRVFGNTSKYVLLLIGAVDALCI